ncbi:hypothetical protein Nepgr_015647 [Nepenthes gracilis]|uniref:EF-hand domain-containing protein n=1 Tax=Nepenthes gracilis TaxID=150966 RepID=A0AAD3SNV8_NEPGR|nr:hypothetical protein Nepgr_015647 [Nepenthes gracilis]
MVHVDDFAGALVARFVTVWFPKLEVKVKVPVTEEQLLKIFQDCDKNKDGRLDKVELKEAFRVLGSRVPNIRACRAIHHCDNNLDGVISDQEMSHLISYALRHGYKVAY